MRYLRNLENIVGVFKSIQVVLVVDRGIDVNEIENDMYGHFVAPEKNINIYVNINKLIIELLF